VVEVGTASRLRGAFALPDGALVKTGGKTGSGDNRYKTFNRYGHETSARVVNRTAAFVFYIRDRYYGVITALVSGQQAASFSFTSALPVTILKMLAPAINARLAEDFYEQDSSPWPESLWAYTPSFREYEQLAFVFEDNPRHMKRAMGYEILAGSLHSGPLLTPNTALALEFDSRPTQLVRGPPAAQSKFANSHRRTRAQLIV